MGYIFKFIISNLKYLDELALYINTIIDNDGLLYQHNELQILCVNTPTVEQDLLLNDYLTNYTPPNRLKGPSIDFPDLINNLSVRSTTIKNMHLTHATISSIVLSSVLGTSSFLDNIDLNNNLITNVTSPSNLLDVTNKYYVDSRFDNFTTGNVNGNFTQGQVIIANTAGNIVGYDTLTFNTSGMLSILTTTNSLHVTNGGSFTVFGGASINKNVYIGGIGYFINTTPSTSITTGAIIISGGVGINGDINAINTSIVNLTSNNILTQNITSNQLNTVDINSNNITTSNLSTLNLISINASITNITTSNLYSNYLYNVNSYSTNITSSNIYTSFLDSPNINSSNLKSSNIHVDTLYTNNINMTPSSDDIFKERLFNASDNIQSPISIQGLSFTNNCRYFTAWLSVFITADTNMVTAFTIEGIQNNGIWELNYRFIGTNTKIKISITNTGQIQYTCPSIPGFISSLMKFRSITTTI